MKDQRSSLPNPSSLDSSGYEENLKMTELTQKWLVLVSCKFSKNMHLSKDTHVLYLVQIIYCMETAFILVIVCVIS